MKKKAILLPFLFSLISILQLFYVAAIAVSPDQIIRPLFIMWGILLILLLPAHRFIKDWNWTGIFLSLFVLGFFFSSDLFSTTLVFILVAGWVGYILGWILKIKLSIQHLINMLIGVGLFFLAYSLWVNGVMLSKIPWRTFSDSVDASRNYALDYSLSSPIKPDVYYIVLDGYSRSDVLQELFEYDNSEFTTYLEGLGFIIPSNYHSNYPMTHLSLSATLNMEYVPDYVPGLEKAFNRWLMKPFIDRSRARAIFENEGYRTISISSNWSITENSTTDIYYHPYPVMMSDFDGFVLGSTPSKIVGPFLQEFASIKSVESQQKIVLNSFDTLALIPEIPGPKFVFAHIISPHPPFVFDKDGMTVDVPYAFNFKDAEEYPGTDEDYRDLYIGQLQYVNQRLQETLSIILLNSEIQPIIIVQADHGSGLMTNFTSLNDTCVKERFSPFAAYYLPGITNRSMLVDVSAVNTFRVIFNEFFEARFPLLEDRQYYFRHDIAIYDFVDVTDKVNDPCY